MNLKLNGGSGGGGDDDDRRCVEWVSSNHNGRNFRFAIMMVLLLR